ncbi:methionyl-tRNA synthetase [Yamadazyma tenuis]|nr:methionyl-tRNA synthetase [Yamadazyma tenuis]
MLLADVRSRWHKLDPNHQAFLTTGTDEHGLKIQNVAEKQGIPPKQLVDMVSTNFKTLASKLNINYDRFIRTTDSDHIAAVTHFWNIMIQKDLVYKGQHSGWYSVSDETFYPDSHIEEVERDGKKVMISSETKNEVFHHTETNYFFRLAQFKDQLVSFLEANPDWIMPSGKYQELLTELRSEPLSDLSVSRPSSRLKWGIAVPGDDSQNMYVWFDALVNYVTSCGFPDTFELKNGQYQSRGSNPWPATHVIGKDIIRFHCIYWPIFLMAAGVELPKQVLVHSHWLSEGFKMSKSLGNVVDPMATCDYYGEDSLRFFLMEHSSISSDSNYSEKYFNFTRDNLIGKYANIVTRCGGASFNIEQAVVDNNNGCFADIDEFIRSNSLNKDKVEMIITLKNQLLDKLTSLPAIMDESMQRFENRKAIQEWWSVLELTNSFLQQSEPWVYNKPLKEDPSNEKLRLVQSYGILLACESVRICSILISPVIPTLSGKLLDRLGVDAGERNTDYLVPFERISYGKYANGKHELPIQRLPKRQ